jgi:O-antigen/teichoic acid export membrane protein
MVRFGLKLAPGYVAGGIARETPVWILGAVSTVAAVGAYSRAWSVAQRFVDFTHRLSEMLFPTLLARRDQAHRRAFDTALWDSIRYGGAIMAFPAAVGGGAAESVMALFGPGFGAGSDALAVLLVYPLLFVMTELQGQAMMARNRPWVPTATALVGAAASIAGTIIGADANGATGAAVGFVAGTLLRFVLQTMVSARDTLGLRQLVPARQFVGWLAAGAFAFAAARFADDAVAPLLLGLVLAGAAGTAAYGAGVLLLAGLLPRDRERITQLLERVTRREAHEH